MRSGDGMYYVETGECGLEANIETRKVGSLPGP